MLLEGTRGHPGLGSLSTPHLCRWGCPHWSLRCRGGPSCYPRLQWGRHYPRVTFFRLLAGDLPPRATLSSPDSCTATQSRARVQDAATCPPSTPFVRTEGSRVPSPPSREGRKADMTPQSRPVALTPSPVVEVSSSGDVLTRDRHTGKRACVSAGGSALTWSSIKSFYFQIDSSQFDHFVQR